MRADRASILAVVLLLSLERAVLLVLLVAVVLVPRAGRLLVVALVALRTLERAVLVLLVAVEVADVARGRADVTTTFGSLRYVTEVKRELRDASREHLEAAHLAQTSEYGGANVPFGQLLVLDLTPHPHGAPRVDERVWLAKHRPPGSSTDRFVVVGVVTGNRRTPHQL